MNNPEDKFCNMALDLDRILDSCPTVSRDRSEDCKQALVAYTIAANKCAQYRLTTFEKKYPGELSKLGAESSSKAKLPTPGSK